MMTAYHSSVYLNPATQTPPVECPLLICVDGKLIQCARTKWASSHTEDLEFETEDGRLITGRFPWTYP